MNLLVKSIAFRVDASAQIGTGHFMRCLTLADMLKCRGAHIRFVSRVLSEHLQKMLEERGYELMLIEPTQINKTVNDEVPHSGWIDTSQAIDAQYTVQALSGQTWDWLVVDHYALDARWEKALYSAAERILVIDDLADRAHDCDLLLDQNLYSDFETRYVGKVPPRCTLLLGPRYALLRDDFRRLREQITQRTGPVGRVLVFFGGVDADNYTGHTIETLARMACRDLKIDVVVGAQHPALSEIEATCARLGYACHVQTQNMAQLMAEADLAIGAGGAATWERCCLGLPTLTFCVAENQRKLVEDASVYGLIYALPDTRNLTSVLARHLESLLENPSLRRLISQRGLATVDGRGVARVVRKMGCFSIGVRLADEHDSEEIMGWRNHPSVRMVSRNKESISREEHMRWLHAILQDSSCVLLVGNRGEHNVGVVRFDIENGCAEVSIYLAPNLGEQGIGAELLESAERWLVHYRTDVETIQAEILGDNVRSHRLFGTSGYAKCSTIYSKKVQ